MMLPTNKCNLLSNLCDVSFTILLGGLGIPGNAWIEIVRVNIFALFPILLEKNPY